jgi:heme/copper-type cytochrome/quinol oxidase subunit 2
MLPPLYRDILFWAFVAICVVAQIGILRPLVAPRPAPQARPGVPATRRAIEVLWTVVPALGLGLLLALTWRAMHADHGSGGPPAASVLADDLVVPRP